MAYDVRKLEFSVEVRHATSASMRYWLPVSWSKIGEQLGNQMVFFFVKMNFKHFHTKNRQICSHSTSISFIIKFDMT